MLFALLWEQPDASMLTVSCLQITLARAWRLAVSSVKHEVFIASIFVNFRFYQYAEMLARITTSCCKGYFHLKRSSPRLEGLSAVAFRLLKAPSLPVAQLLLCSCRVSGCSLSLSESEICLYFLSVLYSLPSTGGTELPASKVGSKCVNTWP